MSVQDEAQVARQAVLVNGDQAPEGAAPQQSAAVVGAQGAVVLRGRGGLIAPFAKKK